MGKLSQKIEVIANIFIILAALAIGGVLVQRYFFVAEPKYPAQVEPKIGSQMNVADVDWAQQPKTLVLVLQAGCRFCTESAPFYKRVIESVKGKNIKLLAVLPTEVEKSAEYLKELGLKNIEVKRSSLGSVQVGGTPTLILTNNKGEITAFWVGKLTPEKEAEVLEKLNKK